MRDTQPSCATCAKAKIKCVRFPDQDACDRCTRLRKQCHTREAPARKERVSKPSNSAQLLALQKKIESLTRALMAKAHEDGENGSDNVYPTPADILPDVGDGTDLEFSPEQVTHRITQPTPGPKRLESLDNQLILHPSLDSHEVQLLLDRYTTLMAPNMPFVHLPPHPTTTTSFTKTSFLLRAIIVVAHFHDTSTQQILMDDLIQRLTTAIFTSAEKSLDLLQALLILCTWYNPHLFHKTSHTTLLHLCMALTTDLALDRDPAACEMAHMATALESCGIPQPQKTVSDAERRAVLGVFWIASTIFTSFRKTDCPTWSPWLQTCLDVLKGRGEAMLAGLVESQRVMHSAMLTPQHREPAVLQAELDDLVARGDPSASSPADVLVQLHRTCARIAIWDSAFASSHLDGIWTCIHALKAYLDTYASLPVPAYPTLPFTVFAQFAFVFVAMVRATFVHIDGFDGTLLRAFVDFEQVMGEASAKYEQVGRLSVDGVAMRNEGFKKWAEKTRWAQVYYGMRAKQDGMRGELCVGSGGTGAVAGEGGGLDGDVLDVAFWDGGGDLQGEGFCFDGLELTST